MKPLIYKGLRKNVNRTEWVSSNGNARVVGNRLEGYEHE